VLRSTLLTNVLAVVHGLHTNPRQQPVNDTHSSYVVRPILNFRWLFTLISNPRTTPKPLSSLPFDTLYATLTADPATAASVVRRWIPEGQPLDCTCQFRAEVALRRLLPLTRY